MEKKCFSRHSIQQECRTKLFRVMKLTVLFLVLGFVAIGATSYSQEKIFSLEMKNASIKKIFNKIENSSEFIIIYNDEAVDLKRKINISIENAKIDAVLATVLDGTQNSFKVYDRQVVITRNNKLTPSLSQKGVKVSGKVTDEDGLPLPGVTVLLKGTGNGNTSQSDGQYLLDNVDPNGVLIFSFIGMETQEIEINQQKTINVVMKSSIHNVNEVVVTALGIKREKKALGYAIQEVGGEDINKVKTTSVASALAGKVSGVQFSQSGTGMGGSTRIVIRGASSLSDNNSPLWVVDGIPIDDSQQYSGASEWGGQDGAGAASQIDMENVENISILKGASASALYGSRAANGVILVTTKKGEKGDIKVDITSNYSLDLLQDYFEMQDLYGQGKNGKYDSSVKVSWGPQMTGQTITNWRKGRADYPMLPQDQVKGFYETGTSFTNNISISGGNELSTFRLSVSDKRNNGITPFNNLNRQSIDLNAGISDSKRFKLSTKVNLIKEKVKNRPYTGGNGILANLIRMPRNIRLQDLYPGIDQNGQQVLYGGATSSDNNPYFQTEYDTNITDVRYRLISLINASYQITDDFKITGKAGIDYYRDQQETKEWKDYVSSSSGAYKLSEKHFREYNADLLLSFNKEIGQFNIGLNAGASIMNRRNEGINAEVRGLYVEGLNSVTNGSNKQQANEYNEKEIQSVYGLGTVSYMNYAFVDFTARNDWSSTLDQTSYFYPSISGSFILSEYLTQSNVSLPDWLSYAKVRGSWAKVGNDTDAYQTANTFEIKTNGTNGVSYAERPTQYPFRNLKPEMQTSKEIGLDLRFFNGRLNFDFTTYHTSTENQVMNISMLMTSGYNKRKINAGEIVNKGIELSLNGAIIKSKNLNWEATVNWGRNTNKIEELSKEHNIEKIKIEDNYILQVWAYEGGEFGEIHGRTYFRDEATNKILVDQNGLPLIDNRKSKIGTINPDWTGSLYNMFSYKNIALSLLIDAKFGGDIVSFTESEACANGTSKRTGYRPADGILVDGIVAQTDENDHLIKNDDGNFIGTNQANTTKVSAEQYWTHVGGARNGVTEEFLYDATYVKLREVALTYNLPKRWISKLSLQKATFSVTARNLLYLYRDDENVNPEGTNGRYARQQAYTYSSLPSTTTLGFNLSLTF